MLISVTQIPPQECSPNWRGHWAEKYQPARVYHDAVYYSCVDTRNRGEKEGMKFPLRRAKLDLTVVFRGVRRRDRDNILARFKSGLDAVKDAGLIEDDDSEHLEIGKVEIRADPGLAPLTIISLTEMGG